MVLHVHGVALNSTSLVSNVKRKAVLLTASIHLTEHYSQILNMEIIGAVSEVVRVILELQYTLKLRMTRTTSETTPIISRVSIVMFCVAVNYQGFNVMSSLKNFFPVNSLTIRA